MTESDGQWYAVQVSKRQGFVASWVSSLVGNCDNLKLVKVTQGEKITDQQQVEPAPAPDSVVLEVEPPVEQPQNVEPPAEEPSSDEPEAPASGRRDIACCGEDFNGDGLKEEVSFPAGQRVFGAAIIFGDGTQCLGGNKAVQSAPVAGYVVAGVVNDVIPDGYEICTPSKPDQPVEETPVLTPVPTDVPPTQIPPTSVTPTPTPLPTEVPTEVVPTAEPTLDYVSQRRYSNQNIGGNPDALDVAFTAADGPVWAYNIYRSDGSLVCGGGNVSLADASFDGFAEDGVVGVPGDTVPEGFNPC